MTSIEHAIKDWTEAKRDEFEERAAILEFDAGHKRGNAELLAYQQIMKVNRERK